MKDLNQAIEFIKNDQNSEVDYEARLILEADPVKGLQFLLNDQNSELDYEARLIIEAALK